MPTADIRILSIAPYRFLPISNGGHQAIAKLHHHIGLHCNDHVVTTDNNGDNPFSFTLHKIFPNKKYRYLPRYGLSKMLQIAKEIDASHIICEHPYMAISAMGLAQKLGIPWFIRSHNIESERFRGLGKSWWPVLAKYERYAMLKADGVFFITREDGEWAMENFHLPESKCHIIPFGTDMQAPPPSHREPQQYGLNDKVPWLYFLGALDYPPNEEAVQYILDEIQPRLNKAGVQYEILIAGKGLNSSIQQRIAQTPNIHTMGFVPDLDVFLKSCDVMLNPVMTGGGIKTKAVEALGYNKSVVSSVSGAAGLMQDVCGSKLLIAKDFDWDEFTEKLMLAIQDKSDMPQVFYDTYYHGHIADKVISILKSTKR